MMTSMPARIVAGDSLVLAIGVGAFPAADGWTVALTLQPIAGGTPATVAAIGGVDAWTLALDAAASAALAPGAHRYLIAASRADERASMAFGDVQILPNPLASGVDQRSAARRALDSIDAVLEQRATSADLKFTFADGRAIEKVPHPELLQLRAHYARIVARENTGSRGPRRVLVRL